MLVARVAEAFMRAYALGDIDRVFYLTARTTGRRLALDALAKLRSDTGSDPPRLRVLELVSRDNACEHPDKACHGESCPLARGFYDRLPAARAAAQSIESWDQVRVRGLAREHGICPYYLGQELARWSDVVVGDVNYYFDSSALLHALRQANDWRVVVLVDEAHNLIERGRAMYSAALDPHGFAELRQPAPASLKRGLDTVNRAWNRVHAAQTRDYEVRTELPTSLLDALARRGAVAICAAGTTVLRWAEPERTLTPLDEDGLAAMVASIRRHGYATRDLRIEPRSSNTIAVPVFTDGKVRASLAMTFFRSAVRTQEAVSDYVGRLKAVSEEITAEADRLRSLYGADYHAHLS